MDDRNSDSPTGEVTATCSSEESPAPRDVAETNDSSQNTPQDTPNTRRKAVARVKFETSYKGQIEDVITEDSEGWQQFNTICTDMADTLWEMEEMGVTPTLADGKTAGNCAALIEINDKPYILVSRTGKNSGERLQRDKDIVLMERFDTKQWVAHYYSDSETTQPSSDVPMHYCALHCYRKFNWTERPRAALHGYALKDPEEAEAVGLPCSDVDNRTLGSTPEDTTALVKLLEMYPYPKHKVFVRRGHGVFILGKDLKDAMETFMGVVKPYLDTGK